MRFAQEFKKDPGATSRADMQGSRVESFAWIGLIELHKHIDIRLIVLVNGGEVRDTPVLAVNLGAQRLGDLKDRLESGTRFAKLAEIPLYYCYAVERSGLSGEVPNR